MSSGSPPAPRTSVAPVVDVRAIAHRYGQRWALRGVSLAVAAEEVLAIVGPNGCGKSTLLRILATALRPTRGEGFVLGADLRRDADQIRRTTALLSHDPALYGDLTAIENLQFAARMLGCPADRSRLEGLLERVGLAGEGDERARFMSSGMQRRLAIARLLLRTPRLLLLDEPFNSLDAEGVRLIVAIAAELRAAGGTVILVAHDLERGRGLEDRVLRMREGVLVEGIEGGTAPTVPARPELVVARGGVA